MDKNYLLFVPSLITKSTPIRYRADVEGINEDNHPEYDGLQTNEAVTKFIIDHLSKEGGFLDKIIMLCTEEVRNERKPQIANKTTLEYYKEQITGFINKRRICEEKIESLFEVVEYIPQNNENENQIINALTEIIRPQEPSEYKKRIYIDFTGGIRSAALTLVFAGRILDKAGVEVSKILYSNLKSEGDQLVGIIEECTRTYQIFSSFERSVEIEHNIVRKDSGDALDNAYAQMQTANKMSQKELADEGKKTIDAIVSAREKKELSYTERQNVRAIADKGKEYQKGSKDPIFAIRNELKNGNPDKALTIFREKIIDVLIDDEIIKVKPYYHRNRGEAIDEIAAAYCYYKNDKRKKTFIGAVKKYISELIQNPGQSPLLIKQQKFGKQYFSAPNYLNEIPEYGYQHNDFSQNGSKWALRNYIRGYCEKVHNPEDIIQRYIDLDRIYMGYGFPFACTYGGRRYYIGYDKLYKGNFEEGVYCLQELYEKISEEANAHGLEMMQMEQNVYRDLIHDLADHNNPPLLYKMFPFQLNEENIWTGRVEKQRWNEFMLEFAEAYDIIKAARNKAAHRKTNWKDGEGKRAIDMLESILSKIEEYREEIGREAEKNGRE